jgi:transcription-repair coupling factor (superfamily II helicase)
MSKAKTQLAHVAERIIGHCVENQNSAVEGIPGGYEAPVALALAQEWERAHGTVCDASFRPLIYIARDEARCVELQKALEFWAPEGYPLAIFPGWDSEPYEYTSPNRSLVAQRMRTLALLQGCSPEHELFPRLVVTTPLALVQRTYCRKEDGVLKLSPGVSIPPKHVIHWLEEAGFVRVDAVSSLGEYAVRGGIIDIFSESFPLRCDFFDNDIESLKRFDPQTQRSGQVIERAFLTPVAEVPLTNATVNHFQRSYRYSFGVPPRESWWYEALLHKRSVPGYEHWLPLFLPTTTSLMACCPGAPLILEQGAEHSFHGVFSRISERYDMRQTPVPEMERQANDRMFRQPLSPDRLYLSRHEWEENIVCSPRVHLSPFEQKMGDEQRIFALGGKIGHNFSAERHDVTSQLFDEVIHHIRERIKADQQILVVACSPGARDRLSHILSGHGLEGVRTLAHFEWDSLPKGSVGFGVWSLNVGFEVPGLTVISEQDIFGNHVLRPARRIKRSQDALIEAQALSIGDGVVHIDHGLGRFSGLVTIHASGMPHDCLEIHYLGGDKLFLPVENIELLSRYGSEIGEGDLDKLGGMSWKARRARLREKIQDIAQGLMKVAAARKLQKLDPIVLERDGYELFTSRFPYDETDDQREAVEDVLGDLESGKVMDRLICGDAGFGKTEVALRAAFSVSMSGKQVAVVVPTTLLARQHYATFVRRFEGFPVHIAQASRFVSPRDLRQVRQDLASGHISIVVGTHALLSDATRFFDLGLVIVDEEQHFGVGHKQRLKEMCTGVHVLTLSATPIPRTLQLALSGVSEISMIRTPPIDRLAVQTAVSPFDALLIRDWLLREQSRGGQAFYVCPRIEDLETVAFFLERYVPEVKVGRAHGQMPISDLEDVMSRFYEGAFSVLLSTAIVESGLDIPNANTIIVHRADRFGLAQLYQLRGRVGRGAHRGYALFTFSERGPLTPLAERRLNILQSLDSLGIGFQLASHDLDLRGAGNLLGTEQSGHIKEVGFELYQKMLDEAIARLEDYNAVSSEELWSPNLGIGAAVMIPEHYVSDLSLRLGLYRRLSLVEEEYAIEEFREELVDRFGPIPQEVESLFSVLKLKILCRKAHIEKLEAGPKGFTIAFRNKDFPDPLALATYVQNHSDSVRIRPETMQLIFSAEIGAGDQRLAFIEKKVRGIVALLDSK